MSKKKSGYGTAPRKDCSKCGKSRYTSRDFYMSNSDRHADGRISVCKQCIYDSLSAESLEELKTGKYIERAKDTLLEMNRPYIHTVWISSINEAKASERKIDPSRMMGMYLKNVNLNHRDMNWLDSVFPEDMEEASIEENNENSSETPKEKLGVELNTQNEKDVLRLLGYDPFEYESEADRPNLFNKLIDYLDESTLEDGFKLSSVIEITKSFNQIDKINKAISEIVSSSRGLSTNAGGIKSLIDSKDKLYSSVLRMAQDNGISTRHAQNSSQGAGTLSGILRQLRDFDFHEAEVNRFNISTAEGIRQVADISNKNIVEQLKFDENDYTEMLAEQKGLIEEFRDKAEKYEEDNRLLRIELNEALKREKELEEEIEKLKTR